MRGNFERDFFGISPFGPEHHGCFSGPFHGPWGKPHHGPHHHRGPPCGRHGHGPHHKHGHHHGHHKHHGPHGHGPHGHGPHGHGPHGHGPHRGHGRFGPWPSVGPFEREISGPKPFGRREMCRFGPYFGRPERPGSPGLEGPSKPCFRRCDEECCNRPRKGKGQRKENQEKETRNETVYVQRFVIEKAPRCYSV